MARKATRQPPALIARPAGPSLGAYAANATTRITRPLMQPRVSSTGTDGEQRYVEPKTADRMASLQARFDATDKRIAAEAKGEQARRAAAEANYNNNGGPLFDTSGRGRFLSYRSPTGAPTPETDATIARGRQRIDPAGPGMGHIAAAAANGYGVRRPVNRTPVVPQARESSLSPNPGAMTVGSPEWIRLHNSIANNPGYDMVMRKRAMQNLADAQSGKLAYGSVHDTGLSVSTKADHAQAARAEQFQNDYRAAASGVVQTGVDANGKPVYSQLDPNNPAHANAARVAASIRLNPQTMARTPREYQAMMDAKKRAAMEIKMGRYGLLGGNAPAPAAVASRPTAQQGQGPVRPQPESPFLQSLAMPARFGGIGQNNEQSPSEAQAGSAILALERRRLLEEADAARAEAMREYGNPSGPGDVTSPGQAGFWSEQPTEGQRQNWWNNPRPMRTGY